MVVSIPFVTSLSQLTQGLQVRFAASRDPSFVPIGRVTKFPYQEQHKSWKESLINKWDSPRMREIIHWYQKMIFENVDPDLEVEVPRTLSKQQAKNAALLAAWDESIYDFEDGDSAIDAVESRSDDDFQASQGCTGFDFLPVPAKKAPQVIPFVPAGNVASSSGQASAPIASVPSDVGNGEC